MNKNISNGVLSYTIFTLKISMPEGAESCQFCPCLKYDNDSNSRRCKWTWEIIPYPASMRGENCPLELIKGDS